MNRQVVESHQIRWWFWALLLALAMSASETATLVIVLIFIVLWVVRKVASVQRYSVSMLTGLLAVILTLRITFQMFFGVPVGSTVLFQLPELDLFAGGLRLGGIFTLESLQTASTEAVVLGGIIITLLASSMMIPVSSLLRRLPAGFSNIALVLSIALSFLPQLIDDVKRNLRANRWRGHSQTRIHVVAMNLINVIETALEKSIQMSASMWRRGLGSDQDDSKPNSQRLFGSLLFFAAVLLFLVVTPHNAFVALMLLGAILVFASFPLNRFQLSIKDVLSKKANLCISTVGISVATIWLSNDVLVEFALTCLVAAASLRMLQEKVVNTEYVEHSRA